ncbi:MAG: protein kinase [Elusimicrobia bacterium]|nr:protein kinase [Elusimicrobiota bacterium]
MKHPRVLLLAFVLISTVSPANAGIEDDEDVNSSPVVACQTGATSNGKGGCVAVKPKPRPADTTQDDVVPDAPTETASDATTETAGQGAVGAVVTSGISMIHGARTTARDAELAAKEVVRDASVPPAVVFDPPKTPEAAADRQEVARLVKSDSPAAAREYALAALQRTPDDPALLSFVKLTEPVKKTVDQRTVRARIAELAAGMRQDEGTGNGAILASPISFGALAGGASRGPAALPAGAVVPDPHANAVHREAGTKIALKDYAGAEAVLTRRIGENPSDAGAFHLRALTRRLLTRFQDSAEDARKAVALNPRDSRSLHLLSRDLTDLGRPQEGLAEAERALAIDTNDAQAYVARSEAFRALGRPEERLSDLARAAALDPKFAPAYEDALALNGGKAVPSKSGRSWPVWFGAIGTAMLFFSFALFPKLRDTGKWQTRPADRVAPPLRPAVPAGYSLGERLGQGGMGVVYEGEDRALKRKVAIKILRPEVAENPRERQRFLKEARTVARLKHPNIVDIHAVHDENGEVWLVFEHIQGETLHEVLGRGTLPVPRVLNFLGQVAAALDYAHAQGVVHQDLKPANIMTAGDVAKVMDFGIARCVRETMSTVSRLEVAGTPAYMAPEQELGGGAAAPAADIFAFGACAYESLSGQMPFPGGHVMIKVEKRYRPLSELAGLPSAIDPVIARALDPEPANRWPTASACIAALARALQEAPAVQRGV